MYEYDPYDDDEAQDEDQRYWTLRRIIFTIITVIVIIAFLVYVLLPLIQANLYPTPQPTLPPPPMV